MANKALTLLGAVLTLAGTYALSFYRNGPLFAWGYPALQLLPDIFTNPGMYVISLPSYAGYVVGALLALFLLAGVLQLIGAAVRGLGLLGSLFAVLGSLYVVLVLLTGTSLIPLEYAAYIDLFAGPEYMAGMIPYHFAVTTTAYPGTLGLGAPVTIVGGILGLLGTASKD